MPRDQAPAYIQEMRKEGKPKKTNRESLRKRFNNFVLKIAQWVGCVTPKAIKAAPGGLLLIAGIYALFSSFVTVTVGDPTNDTPLSAPFALTNTSTFFTLVKLTSDCKIKRLAYKDPSIRIENNTAASSTFIPRLLPGTQDTVFCGDETGVGGNLPVKYADVVIELQYRLGVQVGKWLLPIPLLRATETRFITVPTSDGKLKWIPWSFRGRPAPASRTGIKPVPLPDLPGGVPEY
jgi:hypothetical protein